MRVLLAEDEPLLCAQVKKLLNAEGRVVDVVHNGVDALHLGSTEPYDVIILDLGLPERDGISVLREWRKAGLKTPVLILTARDGWSERVDGLDAGADDYMTKPFHMPELAARVRAILRRQSGLMNPVIEMGRVTLDSKNGRVTAQGITVDLTAQEIAVLTYLAHNRGRLVSRSELSDHIYEYDADRDSNTIAVFITRLRKKLGADLIKTVRGRGYMIDTD